MLSVPWVISEVSFGIGSLLEPLNLCCLLALELVWESPSTEVWRKSNLMEGQRDLCHCMILVIVALHYSGQDSLEHLQTFDQVILRLYLFEIHTVSDILKGCLNEYIKISLTS